MKMSIPCCPLIKIQWFICLKLFWTVLTSKRCLICGSFSPDSDDFSHWRKQYDEEGSCFSWKQRFKVNTSWWICLLQTCSLWITCITFGLLRCFPQLFELSFWRHPFTAVWCTATFLQVCWWNKLIYILDGMTVSTFSFLALRFV